jgi:hypothetical protein
MKEEEIIAKLSHSYFNHILRDVQPFLDYFDHDQICQALNNSIYSEYNNFSPSPTEVCQRHIDSQVVERLFFMACLNSIDISLPFNYSKGGINRKIKKYEWLTDIRPFGSKSKQGVVNKSLIFDTLYIVVKKAKTSKFDEITLRDFCVGINLNKILNDAPFFVRTLGCFQYKNQFHIATEFIDGVNLKEFLQRKGNTFADFLNIFFQILLGLEIAQNKLNFAHYDLHTDNVILVKSNQNFEVSLYGYNYLIKHDFKPVMIDFGLSSVYTKGQTLGQKSLETKGIYNHLSPGYDIYVFLLFCIDIVQTSNISIFKGITDLLLFFKIETNISMDILTNNHIKSLKKGVSNLIPYKFIQYLVQKYPNYLNVDIEPKKYNDKCLGNRPLFLKLKQILDVNDELQLEPDIRYKKGFIKSLMNNIKIYYWYKEKVILSQKEIQSLVNTDQRNLQNLTDDLNLQIYKKGENSPSITIEQKNLFFVALDYYYLILELKLHCQYSFYKKWLNEFRNTFVYKNIFKQLDNVLYEERTKRVSSMI